jgi:hypothetical protein
MDFSDMSSAMRDAEQTQSLADQYASRMARFIVGRLKNVDSSELRDLKRELRGYNIHTGRWKK